MTTRLVCVIYISLLALLGITVVFAYIPLGVYNLPVALAIASAKALLIALFFMELRQAAQTTKLIVGTVLIWGAIFGVLGFADYATRAWPLNPEQNGTAQYRVAQQVSQRE